MSALVSSLWPSSKPSRFVTADLAMDHARWIVPLPGQTEGRECAHFGRLIRRTVDIAGALAGLALLWPLLLILTGRWSISIATTPRPGRSPETSGSSPGPSPRCSTATAPIEGLAGHSTYETA